MNKKLLTMVTTGAIAISNMNFAFAEIPNTGVPKGEEPIFEKIPNAHIPEIEMLMEEFDDEAVEPGDDIMDDVISGEEYEEEETEDVIDEDEAEMERLEREEHEKELAEKEQAEEDDEIMDEIEKDAEKYDKENEEDTIGGIDDDYYDVGEEEEVKDEDPAENIPDEDDKAESNKEKEEVKKSNNKEATHNATTKDTNVNNDTTRAIGNSTPSELKEYQRELEKPLNLSKDNSGNPKTGDMGIIGSIVGMVTAVGGIIFARKKL